MNRKQRKWRAKKKKKEALLKKIVDRIQNGNKKKWYDDFAWKELNTGKIYIDNKLVAEGPVTFANILPSATSHSSDSLDTKD